MHDDASDSCSDAILRHGGEARGVAQRYFNLPQDDRDAVLEFWRSLRDKRVRCGCERGVLLP